MFLKNDAVTLRSDTKLALKACGSAISSGDFEIGTALLEGEGLNRSIRPQCFDAHVGRGQALAIFRAQPETGRHTVFKNLQRDDAFPRHNPVRGLVLMMVRIMAVTVIMGMPMIVAMAVTMLMMMAARQQQGADNVHAKPQAGDRNGRRKIDRHREEET